MTRDEAPAVISAATSTTDLRRGYRALIARRSQFCILGPEFFGCVNSGERARFSWSDRVHGGYVGTESDPRRVLVSSRAEGLTKFLAIAAKAMRFNTKARERIAHARTLPPQEAALILADYR